MKNKIRCFWNDLSLFRKTFILSMMLAVSVILIGEGAEGLLKLFFRFAGLSVSGNVRETSLWVVAIGVCSLFGSLALSRIVTSPLTRIQPVIKRLSQGDLGSRISGADITRGDEIGDLGRSFNQMADNISRLLENERTLIRDISHELRSPLTRMNMALALLRQDAGESPDVAGHLRQLEKDIRRMEEMVEHTLERARLEALSPSGLETSEVDLAALATDSIEAQSPSAAAESKEICFEGMASAPYVGNAPILRRAVDNLIKNALYYTAAGSTVTVRLRSVPDTLILEVADQGPGVPDEHLENIFRPFYRVDAARDQNSGGIGLGLAIVRQAAQLHGGQVVAVNMTAEHPATGDASPHKASGKSQGLKISLMLPIPENAANTHDQD